LCANGRTAGLRRKADFIAGLGVDGVNGGGGNTMAIQVESLLAVIFPDYC